MHGPMSATTKSSYQKTIAPSKVNQGMLFKSFYKVLAEQKDIMSLSRSKVAENIVVIANEHHGVHNLTHGTADNHIRNNAFMLL